MTQIDLDRLNKLIDFGYIRKQAHPSGELFIYNYTPAAQYEGKWNSLTRMSRGLILDREGTITARPMEKFFNFDEPQAKIERDRMVGECAAYEKLDGSLIIVTRSPWGGPLVASRGSFGSWHAERARHLLDTQYGYDWLQDGKTYCFELVSPENRIVVNYSYDRLVLLAVIDTESGYDFEVNQWSRGWPYDIASSYMWSSNFDEDLAHQLQQENQPNAEGYVLRFQNGYRVKVKFEEYVRLHRLMTGVTERTVWEHVQVDGGIDELLQDVPEEFRAWVKNVATSLNFQYESIEHEASRAFFALPSRGDRKTYALSIHQQPSHLQPILFRMLDNRFYDDVIWKQIKPASSKAFWNVSEEETE